MKIFLASLCAMCGIWAEDAPKPPTKKEVFPIIPHIWISEGILCLKARENGLSFATQPQDISHSDFTNTASIQPHFKWNTGLQIDLGYQPRQQYYFASWCYIQNTAYGSLSTNGTKGFFPILSMDNDLTHSSFVTSGNVDWRINTQFADAGTMFPWKPKDFFLLKAHIGLRVASLNQKLKAYYGGGLFNEGTDVLTMHNNFLGIGPRVGLLPNFLFPAGFSLCGEFAASGLLGRFYVKQKESYLAQTLFNQTDRMIRFRFALDAKAYLAWQKELLYKAIVLSVQMGWQWHAFFDQNQLQRNAFYRPRHNDPLFFQGGFLSLSAAF